MERTELRSLDSVPVAECRYVVSRFSSVVPQWERRNPGSARRWVREHAGPCIRHDKRREAGLWDWALLASLRRHRLRVLVQRDVPVRRESVPDNAMFRVE